MGREWKNPAEFRKKEKLLLFLREINLKRLRGWRLVVSSKCDAREKRGVHKSGLTASSFRFRNVYIYLCVCVCLRARGHRYRIHWSDLHFNWILQDLTSSPPIQLDQPAWKETFVRSFELCNPRVPPPVSNNMAFPIIGVAPDDQTRFAWFQRQDPQSSLLHPLLFPPPRLGWIKG